ncbi:MAG TPA: peptidoglycan binding domain-containing protein, partial [Acidimicrobiales bacterium]|nr:peptidoglycan binding domain-containing protein [Acidimicrobiales bacterium]
MRGARRLFVLALASVAALTVVVVAAWALDTGDAGKVARNVTLAGRDVSGLTRQEVAGVVPSVAAIYAGAAVRVETDASAFTLGATDIGLTIDEGATVEAALATGRGGNPASRVVEWLVSFVRPRKAGIAVRADEVAVHRMVAAADEGRSPPTEPSIRAVDGRLEVVEGRPGRGVDPAAVL